MSDLTPELTALLAAVRDALNVPIAHWDEASEQAHHQLLKDRATIARITIEGILDNGHDILRATDWLTQRAAEMPVTYTVWTPKQAEGGERR